MIFKSPTITAIVGLLNTYYKNLSDTLFIFNKLKFMKIIFSFLCVTIFVCNIVYGQTATLQVINTSADNSFAKFDIWIVENNTNAYKWFDDLSFREATPSNEISSGVGIRFCVAPHNSTIISDTILDADIGILTENEEYLIIISGLVNNSGYNPQQPINILFTTRKTYADAGVGSGFLDVTTFNGATDSPPFDIFFSSPISNLIGNELSYKELGNKYSVPFVNNEFYAVQLKHPSNSTIIYEAFPLPIGVSPVANGVAFIAYLTGFVNPTNNNNGSQLQICFTSSSGISSNNILACYDLNQVGSVCAPLTITPNIIHETVLGGADGSIHVNINGGVPPYSYSWSNGNITSEINNLSEGNYTVTITDNIGCSATSSFDLLIRSGLVWPGDVNDDLVVDFIDFLLIGVYNGSSGIARDSISYSWVGQTAQNWTDFIYNGVNMKFVDCNGDGNIDAYDTLAVTNNFGLSHPRSGSLEARAGEPKLVLQPTKNTYNYSDTIVLDIILGDENNEINSFYGIGFEVSFDPLLMKENSVDVIINNSFLGNISELFTMRKTYLSNGKIIVAFTRVNQQNVNGYGKIGEIRFLANQNITNIQNKSIIISNYKSINANVEELYFDVNGTPSFTIGDVVIGLSKYNIKMSEFNVFPNPFSQSNTISYTLSAAAKVKIKITDALGRVIKEKPIVNQEAGKHETQFSYENARGVLFVELDVDGNKVMKRILNIN